MSENIPNFEQVPATYVVSEQHLNEGPPDHTIAGFPFTARSAIRRYTEPATFLHYPLLAAYTVMNPEVAAAVDRHSSYKQHPYGRLASTVDSAIRLVFGSEEESLAIARRLHSFHNTVQGSHRGMNYAANDTRLQEWVLATVFKVGIEQTNNRWAEPLPDSERQKLYSDIKIFGEVFGVKRMPKDVEELDCYWEDNIPRLMPTEASRKTATEVIRFQNSKVPRIISRTAQAVSTTSLDKRLQQDALRPNVTDLRIAAAVDATMRGTYGQTPRRVREQIIPAYLGARRGLARLGVVKRP